MHSVLPHFTNYDTLKHLAIFASGGGSNAQRIIAHFQTVPDISVSLVVSNKKQAGVLEIAREHGIATYIIDRAAFYERTDMLTVLREHQIDFIALAGFLWLIPQYLVQAFPQKMLNIHPALLPKYGGQGMYGMHVHQAVRASGDTETGMTIHFVNDQYDAGSIVFQARCPVEPADTALDIAHHVLVLEHRYYPEVIEGVIRQVSL